ncbi:unnamed protein product [Schistosoma mattheei]|uniref:Uncharacterized protein n=1 Tax=Schistosoma mattheei TaxID=31246 RepID=A0A183NN36_9TREM|nr:unnamed protein product [Schistosoma mattheei]
MKPLSPMNNHSFSLIGNTKHLFKSTELDKSAVNKMLAECRRRLTNRSNKNVLNLIQGISNEWFAILLEQIEHDKFQQLADFIAKEQNSGVTIYPPIEQVCCDCFFPKNIVHKITLYLNLCVDQHLFIYLNT